MRSREQLSRQSHERADRNHAFNARPGRSAPVSCTARGHAVRTDTHDKQRLPCTTKLDPVVPDNPAELDGTLRAFRSL